MKQEYQQIYKTLYQLIGASVSLCLVSFVMNEMQSQLMVCHIWWEKYNKQMAGSINHMWMWDVFDLQEWGLSELSLTLSLYGNTSPADSTPRLPGL